MTIHIRRAAIAALLLGVSAVAVQAEMAAPTAPPEAPKFDAQGEPVFVNRSDIFEYKALPAYSEPAWVTDFVDAGKLPPGGRASAERADGLQDRQHARRHRRLRRRDAPRDRRPAGGLELLGRADPMAGAASTSAWSNA